MKRYYSMFVAVGLGLTTALLPATPVAAQADDSQAYGDDYAAGDYGRVRYQINGLTVLRADTGLASQADVNAPIFPGDTTRTIHDQRAEIQLSGGSMIWIDRSSEVTFLALPDPYATIKDNTIIQLAAGSVGLTAQLADEDEFRIDTPAATVFLLGDGDFRVEVLAGDRVRVTSRRGVAEVVGAGGSVLVRGGTLSEVYPNSTPTDPEPFNTFTSDNFDRFIDERQDQYRADAHYADEAYEALPDEVRPYYAELSTSGRWSRTEEYGYVWYPSSVARGWRPYHQGYWDYGPHGYFWVSQEPWGWAPYHYGRWAWTGAYGWAWVPGRVFGGAWVAWSWGSVHVGWAPLDFWGRPAYYGTRYYGYYDPYCWSFVTYTNFGHGHHGYRGYRDYRSVHDIGDPLRDHAIVTRPPRVSPTKLVESRQNRERALEEVRGNRSVTAADSRPSRNFAQVESRFAGKPPAARAQRSVVAPSTAPSKATGRAEAAPREGVNRSGRAMPSYEPRISTGRPSREAQPAAPREDRSTRPPARDTRGDRQSPSAVRPKAIDSNRSSDSRSIYERMATPRATREREQSSWGSRRTPTAAPSRSAPPAPSATPETQRTPVRPQAAPSRSAPSAPKASPAPSKPSRPQAAPSRSAPSAPKATPAPSKPSRPQAAPSRSAPSRPKAQPKSREGRASKSRER